RGCRDQVAVVEGVDDLKRQFRALNRIEGALRQRQSVALGLRTQAIKSIDEPFDRRLQPRRVVNFDSHFPAWNGQQRTIDGNRKIASQRPRKIIDYIDAGCRLEKRKSPGEIRITALNAAEQFLQSRRWAFYRKGSGKYSPRRDEIERAHRRRRRQPGDHALPPVCKIQRRLV